MSKMSELDICICKLTIAAQSLNSGANGLVALFSDNKPESLVNPEPKPVPKPKKLTLEEVPVAEKKRLSQRLVR